MALRSYASATRTHPTNVSGSAIALAVVSLSPRRNTDATATMLG